MSGSSGSSGSGPSGPPRSPTAPSSAGASLLRIERFNYLVGAILCMGAAVLYPTDISLGVAAGVGLTCLNFAILRRLVSRWTVDAASGGNSNRILLVLPKMIALMAAVLAVLAFLPVNAIAFVIGFSIFMISLTIESIYSALVPAPSESESDQSGHDKTS